MATTNAAAVRPGGRAGVAALAAAAIVPVLVYLPILGHGFLLDDFLLFRPSSVADRSGIARGFALDLGTARGGGDAAYFRYYRPVFLAASTAYARAVGSAPADWHAASLVLAGANGALACALLAGFGASPTLALVGSLVFSLHPSHASSVAWASGLQELLAAFFVLGAVLALLACAAGSGAWALALAAESFVLALLSKEVAIALAPFVALWAFVWRRSSPAGTRALRGATALFAAIAAVYLLARIVVFGELAAPAPGAPGWLGSVVSLPVALRAYLEMLLAPLGFGFFRPERPTNDPWSASVLGSAAALGAAAALAVLAGRRRPAALLPLGWFGIWLLPVLNLWALDPQWMVTDRYLFLPSLALPWAIIALSPSRAATAGLAALALVFAGLTLRYERIFASARRFVEAMERAEPTSALVFAEKGRLLLADGDTAGAKQALRRAVEVGPPNGAVLVALADLEIASGDLAAAEAHYRSALTMRPYPSRGLKLVAVARLRAGRSEEALALVEAGLRLWPADFELNLFHALVLGVRGDRRGAAESFRRAAAIDPDDPAIRAGLDAALANAGARLAPGPLTDGR